MTANPALAARLSRVVPTLSHLAHRSARRGGFTLIEMMAAVALSIIIILTAAKCFQMVTKTVASINQYSVDNGLLRSGLQLAWIDADYWKSYADTNAPFRKGWTRLATAADAGGMPFSQFQHYFQPILMTSRTDTSDIDPVHGAGLNTTSIWNSASPTMATTINFDNSLPTNNYYNDWEDSSGNVYKDPYNKADLTPNPNAMQAHDPRSISRVSVRPMFLAEWEEPSGGACYYMPGYFLGYPRFAIGDYTLVCASDMRDPPGCLNPKYLTNPSGQAYASSSSASNQIAIPRDTLYQALQNDSVTLNIPCDNGQAEYQPLLWTTLFRKLSYVSVEYMNAGTPFWWTDRNGHTPDYDTAPLPSFTTTGIFTPAAAQIYRWDRDWPPKLGNCDLVTRLGPFVQANENGAWNAARNCETIAFTPTWPSVGDLTSGQGVIIPSDYETMCQTYPFTILVGTGNEEATASGGAWWWGSNQQEERGDMTRVDERNTTRTVYLPYNITDYEKAEPDAGQSWAPTSSTNKQSVGSLDLVSKPAQTPVLTTAMVRYGKIMGGSDLLMIRVSIDDPVTGVRVELPCTPTTTTFRGARQHWRLYAPAYTASGSTGGGNLYGPAAYPCVGDYYDLNAGPYYVP